LDRYYHLNKTKEAEALGIHLIHIYEDDWTNKKEIVKNRLCQILHVEDSSTYGRNCTIKELKYSESSTFLDEYHLQGKCNSAINLGLFYEGKLTACMTFGKLRKSLGQMSIEGEYELLRYCSIGRVTGGASKLFKYFINRYNPLRVISYADRHWTSSIGSNLYTVLNFTKVSDGTPNYWYFVNNIKIHRFAYRKSELPKKLKIFDSTFTEYENMLSNGYDRIWGCGSLKYEYLSKTNL